VAHRNIVEEVRSVNNSVNLVVGSRNTHSRNSLGEVSRINSWTSISTKTSHLFLNQSSQLRRRHLRNSPKQLPPKIPKMTTTKRTSPLRPTPLRFPRWTTYCELRHNFQLLAWTRR
jgi:hypothetical protein